MSLDSFLDRNEREVNQKTIWRPPIDEEAVKAEEESKRKYERYMHAQRQGLLEAMKVKAPPAKYTPPTREHLGLPDDRTNKEEIERMRKQFDYEISRTPPTHYAAQILRQVRVTELRTTRTSTEQKKALEDAMDALHEAKNRFDDLALITFYVEDRRDYIIYLKPAQEKIEQALKEKHIAYEKIKE